MIRETSSGAFIFHHSKGKLSFLLLQRKNSSWDLPKGHVERGETLEETAMREIFEETGLKPKIVSGFSVSTSYKFKREGKPIDKRVIFFLAESSTSKVKVSEEHSGYKWVSPDKAKPLIGHKNMATLISKAHLYACKYLNIKKLNFAYAMLPKHVKNWGLSKRLVPGEGPLDASVMIIGQAPGRSEDKLLRPFIGRSGRLLDNILSRSSIDRDKAYITSAVQFFPPDNRIPTEEEIKLCYPFLQGQLKIIRPKFIITLGRIPLGVFFPEGRLALLHGKSISSSEYTLLVSYHPAAALRFKKVLKLTESDFEKFGKIIHNKQ